MVFDEAESRGTHTPVFDSPIKGTLGGWYLGMLKNPPFLKEGYEALEGFFETSYQHKRFLNGAGLPTLAMFYHDDAYSCLLDPILHWELEKIGEYVRHHVIRRSTLRNFHLIRGVLAQMHTDIMAQNELPVSDILSRYAQRLPPD
jgi:hypothetical protein